jgi:hypothetical protein
VLFLELELVALFLPLCNGRERTTAKADPPSGDDKQEKQEKQKQMIERFDGVCKG